MSKPEPAPIGQKFGRLTVVKELEPRRNPCGKSKRMVVAVCECGTEKQYQLGNIKSGNSYSCGCYDMEMLMERNAEASKPQEWAVNGDIAFIEINGTRVTVDAADVHLVSKFRWYIDNNGYVDSMQCDSMHRLILGLKKGDSREGDHVNHVLTDNRRSQLRIATSSQNKMNTRGSKQRASRFKGVTKHRRKWVAQLGYGNGSKFRKSFDTEEEAALAYDQVAKELFGEFAFINFKDSSVMQNG